MTSRHARRGWPSRPLPWVAMAAALWLLSLGAAPCPAEEAPRYVGSKTCAQCHEEQYASYLKNAKKAHSFKSVHTMAKKLTAEEQKQCYECHTTGFGKPGGFVSAEQTPDMQNAGCEVCHGPGSRHAASEDPKHIKSRLTPEDCLGCHNSERVAAFGFKPLIYGGGH